MTASTTPASMYLPEVFVENELALLHDLIDAYPFGMLLVPGAPGNNAAPLIAHLPFLLDRDRGARGTLILHVARANPIRAALEAGAPVIGVFRGPHGYVSPCWYVSRDNVPTWNYVVVHAHGVPRLLDDEELLASLAGLAAVHERGQPDPWTLADASRKTIDELFPAIAGFAVEISTLEGKFKLSQNYPPEDREGAIRGLRGRGAPDDVVLVDLMTRGKPA